MDKDLSQNNNYLRYLYREKEAINRMIDKISDKDIEKRFRAFNFYFDDIRQILKKMGNVLYNTFILYFNSNPSNLNVNDFYFYFWPGFTTLENKRVFIWGSEINRINQKYYYTGIGRDNNGNEFRDCPATVSFDQILNSDTFEGTGFFPGSTHYFRLNQSRQKIGNEKEKEYLRLRIPDTKDLTNGNVFKAIHVTTEQKFKADKNSKHTLLIKINREKLENSGQKIKDKLDKFLDEHNKYVDKGNYRWKWPFNVLPIMDELERKNIEGKDILNYSKRCQKKFIDIQTHLYSFWIAETLGDGSTFRNEITKKKYKRKLHNLLKKNDLLDLERKLGFFEKIDEEKREIETKSDWADIRFNHWYTIFHDGFSVKEDLGSTMFLTSHSLPPELLFPISVWIEDIYNNLKLLESKTIAEYKTQKMDFRILYHTQLPYLELFKDIAEQQNHPEDLIPIIEYLRYGLKIARNYMNTYSLKEDLEDRVQVDVSKILTDSQNMINTLCKNDNILASFFKINEQDNKNKMISFANQNKIITIENGKSIKIDTHKEAFEMIIHELLFNCVKHSIHDMPNIRVVLESTSDEHTISFYNNSKQTYSRKDFLRTLDNSPRQGVKIIKKLSEVLCVTLSHDIIDNIVCATIKFKRYGN